MRKITCIIGITLAVCVLVSSAFAVGPHASLKGSKWLGILTFISPTQDGNITDLTDNCTLSIIAEDKEFIGGTLSCPSVPLSFPFTGVRDGKSFQMTAVDYLMSAEVLSAPYSRNRFHQVMTILGSNVAAGSMFHGSLLRK